MVQQILIESDFALGETASFFMMIS